MTAAAPRFDEPGTVIRPISERDLLNAPALDLIECLSKKEQVEMPVTHYFQDQVGLREIFMPKGTIVVGHVHKYAHWNIVLTGKAEIVVEGREMVVEAPAVFFSNAGAQKALHILEDMRFITVHANPTNEADPVRFEESIINVTPAFLEAKGDLTIDQFRHKLAQKQIL